jgi:chemosensory pili system protein ChpA (sensor histidine kinase/response regulator)
MPETSVVGGLKWVKAELVESLRRVREHLESFVVSGDKTECTEAVAALNEVRGVLLTLQMTAAALLTEEMQRSLGQVLAGSLPNPDEEARALMLALVRLPHYLDQVDAGRAESPLTLRPSINDLRVSRGAHPLSAAELVAPSSAPAEIETPTPDALTALAQLAAKVRPHFHRYLLLAFQRDGEAGLRGLGQLFNQLHRHFEDGVFCDAFRAAEAVTLGIRDAAIPMTPAAKVALGHIDSIFKPLLQPEPAWPAVQARGLIGQLLVFLAESDSDSALVQELDAKYQHTPPVPNTTGAPPASSRSNVAAEAMATLNAEVLRELAVIKDGFDLFVRGGGASPERLAPMETILNQLASTIAIGEDAGLVLRLRDLAGRLGQLVRGNILGDETLFFELAQELLSLEDALRKAAPGDAPNPTGRDAVFVALREARIDLGRAREAITNYAVEPDDLRHLRDATDILPGVAAALRMVGEALAAEVLDGVVAVLRQRFIVEGTRGPQAGDLQLLAQAIAGIEMHLEGLGQGAPFGKDVLAKAQSAMDNLVANLPAGAAKPIPVEAASGHETLAPMAEQVVSHVDPEFLEIFLEDAREDHARIAQALPRWTEDPDDGEALAILQRCFHTLKGSGLLVGAERVAALAAITETLLNRVLGGGFPVTPAVMGYLADACALVPALIEAEATSRVIDIGPQLAIANELLDATLADGTSDRGRC